MPGPTSITPLSGVTPETSAIRGQTVGLMRKFWPRALEKVKPCRERDVYKRQAYATFAVTAVAMAAVCQLIFPRQKRSAPREEALAAE